MYGFMNTYECSIKLVLTDFKKIIIITNQSNFKQSLGKLSQQERSNPNEKYKYLAMKYVHFKSCDVPDTLTLVRCMWNRIKLACWSRISFQKILKIIISCFRVFLPPSNPPIAFLFPLLPNLPFFSYHKNQSFISSLQYHLLY